MSRADLVIPGETAACVLREGDVVGRIRVHEVVGVQAQVLKVLTAKLPVGEDIRISDKVARVRDPIVAAERHVELAAAVEAAESVVPGAIQVVEQRRDFDRPGLTGREQVVEAKSIRIERRRVILHLDPNRQAALQVTVKVDEMGIDVVDERPVRRHAQRHREASAKRLDQPARLVSSP